MKPSQWLMPHKLAVNLLDLLRQRVAVRAALEQALGALNSEVVGHERQDSKPIAMKKV